MAGLEPEHEVAVRNGTATTYFAARIPDEPAIVCPSGARTWAELDQHANQLARALRRHGLGPGDSIAVLCTNRAEYAEIWAACVRSGLRQTNVNWHLTPDEAAYIVADCGARAFIADTEVGDVPLTADDVVRLSVGGDRAGFERYDEVITGEDPAPIPDPTLGTAMLYTSGTTGYPKGVRKPPDPDGYVQALLPYAYRPGDVHLCTGPLYHAAPWTISLVVPLSSGVPVVVMPAWDPEEALRLIDTHRVTHTHMVPTMFQRLLGLPDEVRSSYDLSSLKGVVHGAAPCPVEIKRRIIDWFGPVLFEYYSATEGYGTVVDSATWLRKPGTVGPALPEHLYVGDAEGNRLPIGEEGLVWIRTLGPQRFEYHGDHDKTSAAYQGDHFTLGDIGRVDDDGFLFLTDRSANLIISGGVNIYPAEVDAVLLSHPAVADAATIGVPDEEWGERVLSVVELRTGASVGAEELIAHCRERLAHFKCPRQVDFVAHLPRDDNGKLYKRRLRDDYRTRAVSD